LARYRPSAWGMPQGRGFVLAGARCKARRRN
jgi:hypothetical protein